MDQAFLVTLFGSLISFLLGILTVLMRRLTQELSEIRKVVTLHGQKLSSVETTLKHMDRRENPV